MRLPALSKVAYRYLQGMLLLLVASSVLAGTTAEDLSVDRYKVIRKTRIDALDFKVVFRARLRNAGSLPVSGISAKLVRPPKGRIIDGSLRFPPVLPGKSALSEDTFALLWPVAQPINPNALKANLRWELDFNVAPVANAGPDQAVFVGTLVNLDGASSTDVDGDNLSFEWSLITQPANSTVALTGADTATPTFIPDQAGDYIAELIVEDGQLESSPDTALVSVAPAGGGGLPPDPATVAPPTDPTVATDVAAATEFLYTGPNPIQTGVAPGTIEPVRAAVLRGRVLDKSNQPLPGVTITVLNHPEFGQTLSRADGMFDMAVNGGGPLTVNYSKAANLPAQRQVNVPWRDYVMTPDVVLIPLDPQVTTVDLTAATPIQVARGSMMTDADGSRQATVLFAQGTQAQLVMPDGSSQPLTTISVRATEYTVGPNGPQAMPAELPPTSAYTYAVELSADEARAAGAIAVRFSPPLPFYIENFLGFPVATSVPLGSYDAARGVWVPAESGRVIKVLSVTNGLADLDLDGDGLADGAALAALSITDAERQQLAGLYQPAQSLWRVLIPHFSPWDLNWPFGLPADAESPAEDPERDEPLGCATTAAGSIIECQNQILGEALGVVGTRFDLHYQSERVPGRKVAYTVEIPLSDIQVPASLRRIELEIQVAGRLFRQGFGPDPNQRTTFTWDGRDAYGRTLQGTQPVTVRIGYTYGAVYSTASDRFGSGGAGSITGSQARQELTLWRTWIAPIGNWNAFAAGLGGWALSAHHAYEPSERVLYRGDGRRESARERGPTISTYAGTGVGQHSGDGGPATQADVFPQGLAVGPDGSLYIASFAANRIRRVAPDGTITTVAGNGTDCSPTTAPCGDGGLATQAQLGFPFGVALGPDNSLYIPGSHRVRKVSPDGTITTIAGTGVQGFSGDGGPGHLARLNAPLSPVVGPDGGVYFADSLGGRIRRVGPDGVITTVAGTGTGGFSGDGGPATLATIGAFGLAIGRDGSLYIGDTENRRVRRVTPDGIIRTIAGTGVSDFSGDGGPATQARMNSPVGLAVAADDTLYITDTGNNRIRWVHPDGTINTLAGTGQDATSGDGGLASQAALQGLRFGLAVGPDGTVYVSQTSSQRVRRISPIVERFVAGELVVPAEDGSEIYFFTGEGRHLRTLDALTGALRYAFAYDGGGRLATVTDGDGNVTTIERDAAGSPTTLAGPFGQRTALASNPEGYLSRVTSPAGKTVQLAYTTDGLLTDLTNPRGQLSRYAHDGLGRLTGATDPTGATKTLSRTGTNKDYTVTLTSALGRATTYRVEGLSTGDVRRTTTVPGGAQVKAVIGTDGRETGTYPDGTTVNRVLGPDPRWGMRAPLVTSLTVTTPGGKVYTRTSQRTATLATPGDLLSLRTIIETVTINGRVSTTVYDAPTRTLTHTSPTGRRTSAVVDDRGRPVQAQFGDLDPSSFVYDARGRLATTTQGAGTSSRTTTLSYGGDGFLNGVTDALGRTVGFTGDADGRITEQAFPDGGLARFAYDANGNVSTLTPPGRPDHTFSYTERDQVSVYAAPTVGAQNNQTGYGHDADRQPFRLDRPDGQSVGFQYDIAGRLRLVDLASGDLLYGYDAANRLASMSTPAMSLTLAYDGGLLTGTAWSGAIAGSVSRTYDNDFRLAAHNINGSNAVAVQYDADSLPIHVGDLSLTRAAQTGMITATALGASTDAVGYDGFGAPASYTASHNGGAVYAATYSRDLLGRLTSKTETTGGATRVFGYTYDLAGRLSEVRQDGVLTASYTYDANGNRLSRTEPGGTLGASYDAQDRVVQHGSTTYTYSPNGELQSTTTGGPTTTYEYDGLGNLSGVTLPGGTQVEYLLDSRDRRVGKRVNGVLVHGFLYQDGLRPIAELDGAGTVVSRFVYATGASVPDYLVKGGVTHRIISDHLGSPRLVLDIATGQITQRMDYDEFGKVIVDTNPGFQPFGFAGGLYDRQTGLLHFGAREYDPETGRWTTKDPIGFAGGDGNLYAYVGNDPVNSVDPDGLAGILNTCTANPAVCAVAMAPRATAIAVLAARIAEPARRGLEAASRGGSAAVNAVERLTCATSNPVIQTFEMIVPQGAPRVFAGEVVNGGSVFARTLTQGPALADTLMSPRTAAAYANVKAHMDWVLQALEVTRPARTALPTWEEERAAGQLIWTIGQFLFFPSGK